MSLTSILKTPLASKLFRDLIRNPGLSPKPPVRVPRQAPSPQRVGTAIDYAIRFGLEARGLGTASHVVAETAMSFIEETPELRVHRRKARERLTRALAVLRELPPASSLSRSAASACFSLVALDTVYRCGRTEQLYQPTSSIENAELRALYEIIPWASFRPRHSLILNPIFGEGSELVGGADADMILDDTLVEVKTVKDQALDIRLVRQLVGYALLANRFGIQGVRQQLPVANLGVYFARAGVLHRFPLVDAAARPTHQKILDLLTNGMMWQL